MKKDKSLVFEEYYERYYLQVLKHVMKKIGNYEHAEDITMESFLICYQKFDIFDETKASFATWLYVIVNNKIKNYYRDHKLHDDVEDVGVAIEGHEDEFVGAMYLDELRQHLANALKTLPEVQRKIIVYKYFHNKSAVEISELVGISSGNVRVQLTRILKKLKEYFTENNIEWENW